MLDNLPLVSIVIPVYNTSAFLKRCLDSCLSQTYSNCEIVVLNDGSTDNSLDILLEYAEINRAIKLINKHNEGLILTRKRGVIEANGLYVFFLDSDDYLPENAIDILVSFANKNSADVTIGRACYFWDNGKKIYKNNYDPLGLSLEEMYASLILGKIGGHIWGTLIKKTVLNTISFSKSLIVGEDLSVQMQIRNLSEKIFYIPDIVYYYYQNPSSIMHLQSDKILNSHINFCKWQIEYVNSLSFGKNPIIEGALAYSVLNGLFAYVFNGGSQKKHLDYISMVNSTYLKNQFAQNHLPIYILVLLRLNKHSSFIGSFFIRSLYYLRTILKR